MARGLLGEADRIVVLFTRELGPIDAVVKGVRTHQVELAGAWSRSTSCDLIVVRGRGTLYTITAA